MRACARVQGVRTCMCVCARACVLCAAVWALLCPYRLDAKTTSTSKLSTSYCHVPTANRQPSTTCTMVGCESVDMTASSTALRSDISPSSRSGITCGMVGVVGCCCCLGGGECWAAGCYGSGRPCAPGGASAAVVCQALLRRLWHPSSAPGDHHHPAGPSARPHPTPGGRTLTATSVLW